jgi:hypothetical protein
MSEQALESLRQVIDPLGSNMWLHLDEVSFPRFFSGPLSKDSKAIVAAAQFAAQHGFAFIFDPDIGVAKFGRVYFKDV